MMRSFRCATMEIMCKVVVISPSSFGRVQNPHCSRVAITACLLRVASQHHGPRGCPAANGRQYEPVLTGLAPLPDAIVVKSRLQHPQARRLGRLHQRLFSFEHQTYQPHAARHAWFTAIADTTGVDLPSAPARGQPLFRFQPLSRHCPTECAYETSDKLRIQPPYRSKVRCDTE
jgi:hypothetical protein